MIIIEINISLRILGNQCSEGFCPTNLTEHHKIMTRCLMVSIPCLLSTSIREVNAVPPTVHSSTGAAKFPTYKNIRTNQMNYVLMVAKKISISFIAEYY